MHQTQQIQYMKNSGKKIWERNTNKNGFLLVFEQAVRKHDTVCLEFDRMYKKVTIVILSLDTILPSTALISSVLVS